MNCLECRYCAYSPMDSRYHCDNMKNRAEFLGLGTDLVFSTEWWESDKKAPQNPSCGGKLFDEASWSQKVFEGKHGSLYSSLALTGLTLIIPAFLAVVALLC